MTTKLSEERVFLTHPQVKKVAAAIRDKKSIKLRLRPDQTVGHHPLFFAPTEKLKIMNARTIGKGCTCEIGVKGLEKSAKAGKGMYMFGPTNAGKGMYMFGQNTKGKSKKPPVVAPVVEVADLPKEIVKPKIIGKSVQTGNTAPYPITLEAPINPNLKKKVGGQMKTFQSLSYGASGV